MGLLRDGGPLQGVTTKDDWTALGYQVTEGDFSSASVKAGRHVTIERDPLTSVHPIDNADFEPKVNNESLLDIHVTDNFSDDVSLVVNNIQQDLEAGLRPEDIAVICLESSKLLAKIKDELQQLGIMSRYCSFVFAQQLSVNMSHSTVEHLLDYSPHQSNIEKSLTNFVHKDPYRNLSSSDRFNHHIIFHEKMSNRMKKSTIFSFHLSIS